MTLNSFQIFLKKNTHKKNEKQIYTFENLNVLSLYMFVAFMINGAILVLSSGFCPFLSWIPGFSSSFFSLQCFVCLPHSHASCFLSPPAVAQLSSQTSHLKICPSFTEMCNFFHVNFSVESSGATLQVENMGLPRSFYCQKWKKNRPNSALKRSI